MIRFGIVGSGWRTGFYLRVARAWPDQFQVTGVVSRNPAKTSGLSGQFGVPLYATLDDLVGAGRPMFVVTSVPWDVNPLVLHQLAAINMPVLSETPPATTIAELVGLVEAEKRGARFQVAEQYWLQPLHAAQYALACSGKIGRVSQVDVSAAHGYHGISLIRRFLGLDYENARITAQRFTFPITQGPGRHGPPAEEAIVHTQRVIALFDFDGYLGLYDFTGDQYFSYIRSRNVRIRGERGEIVNDRAVYLQDVRTPVITPFIRQHAALLHGAYLRGIQAGDSWVYHNPLEPAASSLSDELIAVGACLLKMAEYVEGGEPFYSLAEACQDRYLDIMLQKAVDRGQPVVTDFQPWAESYA